MTAEIAVMNKLGVALAADSAVTIGGDTEKIYSSVDKLFQLTEHAPVAIMIYDGAEFLGIPWETIIKAYGKKLKKRTFFKLSGYVDGLFNFIESSRDMQKYTSNDKVTRTGIIFAGFGEKEYMPVLSGYEIFGIKSGKVERKQIKDIKISKTNGASINPFAQREIVDAFLRGIHSNYMEYIKEATRKLFEKELVEILKKQNSSSKQIKSSSEAIKKSLNSLFNEWENESMEHWGPIIAMVEFLPKDELASMAKMLVNLTKFHRRISPERETVGGPIDVALITKGDGFMWVEQKTITQSKLT